MQVKVFGTSNCTFVLRKYLFGLSLTRWIDELNRMDVLPSDYAFSFMFLYSWLRGCLSMSVTIRGIVIYIKRRTFKILLLTLYFFQCFIRFPYMFKRTKRETNCIVRNWHLHYLYHHYCVSCTKWTCLTSDSISFN